MKSFGQGQFDLLARLNKASSCDRVGTWRLALTVLVLLSPAMGCQRINLPRIDPTGQRIFLPCPNTTELNVPQLHATADNPGIFQPDAFPTPTAPPPCLDGSCPEDPALCNLFNKHLVSKVHEHFEFKGRGAKGEIQLTPLRVVAPVCGEVVLLAGICGEDGYLLKREPIEWMLSPDSVGQIIEVGDDSKGKLISSLSHGPKVEKLDVDFAKGRTSSREATLTRGTPGCEDDIQLKKGQTWLSLSSPSEGVSRVTVLAPDSELWDHRRRTATIYWVDAQWQFPEAKVARSNEVIALTTRVTRAENLVPAEGWRVRYTIVDPNIATFEPPIGTNIAVVQVNANGQAPVQLRAASAGRGTTPVLIEVIRPAQPSDNLPELIIGRGQTMATFSSPLLEVVANGSAQAAVGDQVTYNVTLANAGDLDAENVRLVAQWPVGMEFVNAAPLPSQRTDSGATWDQGVLAAQRQLDVSVTLMVRQPGNFNIQFNGVGQPNLAAQANVPTQVAQATVGIRFAPAGGVAEAEVNQTIEFELDVFTEGQTLTNLRAVIETDPGLQEINGNSNRVQRDIPMLARGTPAQLGVAFVVRQEGEHRGQVTIFNSNNTPVATRQFSVIGRPMRQKQPALEVTMRGPQSFTVGQDQDVIFSVRNTGQMPLTGIKVLIASDPSLLAVKYDPNNHSRISKVDSLGTQVEWRPPNLMPGEFWQCAIGYSPRAVMPQARITAQAGSAEGGNDTEQIAIPIASGGGAGVPPSGNPQPNVPLTRSGDWGIRLFDLDDPVIVGADVRYVLTVVNNQNMQDRQVRIQFNRPQGARIKSISRGGTELAPSYSANSSWVDLPVEQFVRSGEQLEYVIVIVPEVVQSLRLEARVSSEGIPVPRDVSETTTVNLR